MKKHELTDQAVGQWWPESLVHQLDEVRQRRWPNVELQPVIPLLRIIGEVEGCICDAPVLQGALHAEVVFALVQPWQGIVHVIVHQKLHLVRGGETLIILLIISSVAAIWRTPILLVA
jgi:hypothetical protein